MQANGRAITQVNSWYSLVTLISCGQGVEDFEASSCWKKKRYGRPVTHDGVKRDGAFGKFCWELGRPMGQHLWESEEAIVVMKRVMTVERRASA